MAFGTAGSGKKPGIIGESSLAAALLAAAMLSTCAAASAQAPPGLALLPKECAAKGSEGASASPLPNVAVALKERKKITILAIGGTSASLRGRVSGGHYATVERFLEQTFKGLDVAVVHRGVSGELAAQAVQRIKNEVALVNADLVLWQIGTADVLALVPIDEFKSTVSDMLVWLKQHNVDVVLVGMRYARNLAKDPNYQEMRRAIQAVAKQQSVLRVSRYEAEEFLDKLRQTQGVVLTDAEITDAHYICVAEYVARSIAVGLFVKEGASGTAPVQK